jgi:hypothetical protein
MDRQVKNLGVPEGMMKHHLYLALIPNRHMARMFKHKVLYDGTLAYELWSSSYAKIMS